MTKRLISALLLVAIFASFVPAGAFSNGEEGLPFRDVAEDNWFRQAVEYVYEHGIFNGVASDRFAPADGMTRAMFVTALGRFAGITPEDYAGTGGFTDVIPGSYYAPYVVWAAENGITEGVGGGRFDVDATVTREEIAVFFYRYFQLIGISYSANASKAAPSDIQSVSSWAQEAVLALWSIGIFKGDGSGTFNPSAIATRAEAATLFMNTGKDIVAPGGGAPVIVPDSAGTTGGTGGVGNGGTGGSAAYTVSFESNGGGAFEAITVNAGETIPFLPQPEKGEELFLGWYSDSNFNVRFTNSTAVNRNYTLYAKYAVIELGDVVEEIAPDSYTLADQEPEFSFTIIDRTSGLVPRQVLAGIALHIKDQTDYIELEVTGGDGIFYVSAKGGFIPGGSYQLELINEVLSFDGQQTGTRTCDFTIALEENTENLGSSLNKEMIYVPASQVANMTKQGQKIDSLAISPLSINTTTNTQEEASRTEGTFIYLGNETLAEGDLLCVYSGENPQTTNAASGDEDIAYVKITSIVSTDIRGTTVEYVGAEMEEVLPLPETIPVDGKLLKSQPVDTEYGTYITYDVNDLNLGQYVSLGLSDATVIDEGDYVAIFSGEDIFTSSGDELDLGKITKIEIDDGGLTHLWYSPMTLEEMHEQESFFSKSTVDGEEMLENIDVDKVQEEILRQADESGIVEQMAKFMSAAAMETETVKGYVGEDFVLDELSFENEDGSIEVFTIDHEENESFASAHALSEDDIEINVLGDVDTEIAPAASKAKVTIVDANRSIQITTKTVKIDSGLRVAFTVEFKLKIAFGDEHENALFISLYASFVEELGIDVNIWIDTQWFLFFVTEWIVNASIDLLDYTAIEFRAHIWTGADANTIDIKDEIQKIMSHTSPAEAASGVAKLFDLYKEMLSVESDYINVLEHELWTYTNWYAFGLINIKISVNLVLGLNCNVALGMNFDYINGTRYLFWVRVFAGKAGSETISLIDEEYNFQFYVMGMFGIRLGFEFEFAIGLISADVNSIGLVAATGVYFEIYGYFMYELNVVNKVKRTKSSGALYMDFGIYLEIAFKAQVLKERFSYEYPFVDEQWSLLEAGTRMNVFDFAYKEDAYPDTLWFDTYTTKLEIPVERFRMYHMDMKDAEVTRANYPASDFTISFTNVQYTTKDGTVVTVPETLTEEEKKKDPTALAVADVVLGADGVALVTPPANSFMVEADMHITWKNGPLSFTNVPIRRTSHVQWSVVPPPPTVEKYTVNIYLNWQPGSWRETGTQLIWSQQYEFGETPELPTIADLCSERAIAGYNIELDGKTYNLAYDTDQLKYEGDPVSTPIFYHRTYYVTAPERQYSLTLTNVKPRGTDFIESHTQTRSYFETFDFSNSGVRWNHDMLDSGTRFEVFHNISVHDRNDNLLSSQRAGSLTIPCSRIAQYLARDEEAYATMNYNLTGVLYTVNFVSNNGAVIPPFTARCEELEPYALRKMVQRYLTDMNAILVNANNIPETVGTMNNFTLTAPVYSFLGIPIEYELNGGYFDAQTVYVFDKPQYSVITAEQMGVQAPKRDGYTFDGWKIYPDDDFSIAYSFPFDTARIKTKVMLYATWKGITNDITYHVYTTQPDGTNVLTRTTADTYTTGKLNHLLSMSRPFYNFTGWYDNPNFEGSVIDKLYDVNDYGPKVFYGSFVPVTHTISIEYDGGMALSGTGDSIQFSHGDKTVSLPSAEVMHKDGYMFDGWLYRETGSSDSWYRWSNGRSLGALTSNYTFKATWKKATYSITYHYDPANPSGVVKYSSYDIERSTFALPVPTKAGWHFNGWFMDEAFETHPVTTIPAGSFGNRTFYASWTQTFHSVTYELGEGASWTNDFEPITKYGYGKNKIFLPAAYDVERAGYVFNGWCAPDSASKTTYFYANDEKDLTFVAQWKPVTYQITYIFDGVYTDSTAKEHTVYTQSFSGGETAATISLLPSTGFTRTGYTFGGWYDNAEFEGEPITEISGIQEDTWYFLKWNPLIVNVTFDLDGGQYGQALVETELPEEDSDSAPVYKTYAPPATVTYGTRGALASVGSFVERQGYTFKGWCLASDETKTILKSIGENLLQDTTYKAVWTPNTYKINYYNGNTYPYFTQTHTYDTVSAIDCVPPAKTGYRFIGWSFNLDNNAETVATIPANNMADVSLFAQWEPIEYQVTFQCNGGTIPEGKTLPSTYSVVDNLYLPSLTRAHYQFSGWYVTVGEGDSAKDVRVGSIGYNSRERTYTGDWTIFAKWVPVEYTLRFNFNGGALDPETVLPTTLNIESETFVLPTAVSRADCQLEGWYTDAKFTAPILQITTGSMTAHRTVYAKWSGNVHAITYQSNGATFKNPDALRYSFSILDAQTYITLPTADDMTHDGHTFGGWYESSDFSGSPVLSFKKDAGEDKVFYAKWTKNSYTIAFQNPNAEYLNGYTLPTSYTYGDTILLPTAAQMERTGYDFVGWYSNRNYYYDSYTEISATDTGNKTFYAKWKLATYPIRYELNGGDFIDPSKAITSYTYSYSYKLPTVAKLGYTFLGWYETADFQGEPLEAIAGTYIGETVFYAKWEVNTYKLNLDTNGGSFGEYKPPETITFGAGEVVLPTGTQISRAGYTFDGWYDSSGMSQTAAVSNSVQTAKDQSFTARWATIDYTLTFDYDGGTLAPNEKQPEVYTAAASCSLPKLEKAGFAFLGWREDGAEAPVMEIPANSSGNKSFTAVWKDAEYTLDLVIDGGTLPQDADLSLRYNVEKELPIPTRSGYAFMGWYSSSRFLTSSRASSVTPTGVSGTSYTFYALWSKDVYSITLERNGGRYVSEYTANLSYTVELQTLLPDASNIYRTGYTFAGWFDNPDLTGEPIHYASGTGNKAFYAKWTPAENKITYVLDGGTLPASAPTGYTTGETFDLPVPTKDGCSFSGWVITGTSTAATQIKTTDAGNKSFTATWTKISYSITYEKNGGTLVTGDYVGSDGTRYKIGTTGSLPSDSHITRDGYTFGGWYEQSDFSGEPVTQIVETDFGNKVYYAKWTGNTYTITYHEDGGTFPDEYAQGYVAGKETALPALTKDGYSFDGWYNNSGFIGSRIDNITVSEFGNKVFYAKWSAASYTVTLVRNEGTFGNPQDNVTSYTYGVGADLPNASQLSRVGHELSGWCDNAELSGNVIWAISTTDSGNKTFYAKWSPETYTLTLDLDGGVLKNGFSLPTTYTYGTPLTLPTGDNVTKEYYTLIGWHDGDSVLTEISAGTIGDKSLSAQWEGKSYTITYHVNDGTLPDGTLYSYQFGGNSYDLPVPTREDYTFDGWFFEEDFSGTKQTVVNSYIDGVGDHGDKTYYAKWTPTNYTIRFYSGYGSNATTNLKKPYGEAYDFSDAPTYSRSSSYTFLGWATTADGAATYGIGGELIGLDTVNYPDARVDSNGVLHLYGQWDSPGSSNEPMVTYYFGENSANPQEGDLSEALAALAAQNEGGTVELPDDNGVYIIPGVYTVPHGVTINGNGATLMTALAKYDEDGVEDTTIHSKDWLQSAVIFDIESNSQVTIKNIKLVGGVTAAVRTAGRLTLENVTIEQATFGVLSADALNPNTIHETAITNCTIRNSGSAVVGKNVTIEDSTIMDILEETAVKLSGMSRVSGSLIKDGKSHGIEVCSWAGGLNDFAEVLVENTSLIGNAGWGIRVNDVASAEKDKGNVLYTNNVTISGGGGISISHNSTAYILNATIAGNVSSNGGDAVGLSNQGGYLYAVNCLIAGNYTTYDPNYESNVSFMNSGMDSESKYYFCVIGGEWNDEPVGDDEKKTVSCIKADSSELFEHYDSENTKLPVATEETLKNEKKIYVVVTAQSAPSKLISDCYSVLSYDVNQKTYRVGYQKVTAYDDHEEQTTPIALKGNPDWPIDVIKEYQGGASRNVPVAGSYCVDEPDPRSNADNAFLTINVQDINGESVAGICQIFYNDELLNLTMDDEGKPVYRIAIPESGDGETGVIKLRAQGMANWTFAYWIDRDNTQQHSESEYTFVVKAGDTITAVFKDLNIEGFALKQNSADEPADTIDESAEITSEPAEATGEPAEAPAIPDEEGKLDLALIPEEEHAEEGAPSEPVQ